MQQGGSISLPYQPLSLDTILEEEITCLSLLFPDLMIWFHPLNFFLYVFY